MKNSLWILTKPTTERLYLQEQIQCIRIHVAQKRANNLTERNRKPFNVINNRYRSMVSFVKQIHRSHIG